MPKQLILDACCGSRMFWFNKQNPNVVFIDNREEEDTLCDGRKLKVKPGLTADFRNMPFQDSSFKMVVFDPPHLIRAGSTSWLAKKYGVLPAEWEPYIRAGFSECMRVLEYGGTLIFKWNTEQISLPKIFKAIGQKPLYGDKRGKTHWFVFMKGVGNHA